MAQDPGFDAGGVIVLGVVVLVAMLIGFRLARPRDTDRKYAKLRQRLAQLNAEIEYLEEHGLKKAGTFDTPLKDLRVERAGVEEKLKLIEDARKRAGTTRMCPDTTCGHQNGADAKHCARCGHELN